MGSRETKNEYGDFRQAEGGLDQNHYTCDHINVIFIYSETFPFKRTFCSMNGVKVVTKVTCLVISNYDQINKAFGNTSNDGGPASEKYNSILA